MTALGLTTGTLRIDQFFSSSTAVGGNDATDRIIYNTTSGALYYDADGSGNFAAVQIALMGLSIYPTLAYQDFLIV
jgi:Ca2+-binding RTX toxin-like protein